MDAALLPRYLDAWKALAPAHDQMMPAGLAVLDAYDDPARPYHNIAHLRDVLQKLDWAKESLAGGTEMQDLAPGAALRMFARIELALFYHDAVYDVRARDNEAQSRDWFLKDAELFGMAQDDRDAIARLIDITARHTQAASLDEKIMSDCDLSILGETPGVFAAYDRNIRREYAHVPAPLYAASRKKALAHFRDADPLFKTAAFQARYGAAARDNLAKATAGASPMQKIARFFRR